MASNYTKPSGKQVTVAPDNMGKGFTWNSTSNQYEVNVKEANGVKVNSDGTVGLVLSPDTGNLIELRNNGLYYGLTPEPDKRYLYVSTTLGNDSNSGSYSSPLKTIKGAFAIINNSGQHHEIRLRAGEHFELDYNSAEDTSIALTSYYDQFISSWDKVPFYRPESSTRWNRPTVHVRKRTQSWNQYNLYRDRIYCRAFYATGIAWELDDTDPTGTSNLAGNIAGFINAINANIQFTGCIFTFRCDRYDLNVYRRDAWLRVKGVTFLNCKLNNKPDDIKVSDGSFSKLLYHVYYPSINNNTWIDDLKTGGGVYDPLTPIVDNEEEFRNQITLSNVCTSLNYDKDKKAVFGCLPTWDIFNYS